MDVNPSFTDNKLGQVAAPLAADEAMPYAALTSALDQSLLAGALTFRA